MRENPTPAFVLPRPGKALWGVMITLFAIWLAFALGLNWGGAPGTAFAFFCGNTDKILEGEVWRLFTAPLLHEPRVGAIFFALLGFYFLTPSLEQKWGGPKLIRFLILSSTVAYLFQMLMGKILPASVAAKLIPEYWFSSMPAIEAIAIAWAMSFKGQTVQLFFVLPVTSRGLVLFVVAMSVLMVITLEMPAAGLISPFGGMLAGWLFGGSPSPARRFWLKLKLRSLEREAARDRDARKKRVQRSGLKVIQGDGKDDDDRGPDGKLLN